LNLRKREYDFWLLFTILVLLAMGLIMVFSASSYYALYYLGNKSISLFASSFGAGVCVALMFLFSKSDYHRIAQASPILMGISTVLLVLVLLWVPTSMARDGGSISVYHFPTVGVYEDCRNPVPELQSV
jgi:cell division protein FtsW